MSNTYKSKPRKVVIGVILLILAAALAAYWFFPDTRVFLDFSIWQILLGPVLLYWLVMVLFFGRSAAVRMTFVLPLAFLFLTFERNIGTLCGLGPNLVQNWVVIVLALLLSLAFLLIFSKKKPTVRFGETYAQSGNAHSSRLQDSVAYFDLASGTDFSVANELGALNVFFQNAEYGDAAVPVHLHVHNRLGETTIHVPDSWNVENEISSSLGEVDCSPNAGANGRRLIISGDNELGEVSVVR